MMQVAFTKMQALGNDFVIIDNLEQSINLTLENIRAVTDRKLGIGCDQVLLILPGDDQADFRVRIFNADGGEAYQCGNGMRCITKYLVERSKIARKEFQLRTAKSVMQAHYRSPNDLVISVLIPQVSTDHRYIQALQPWLPSEVEHIAFVDVGNWHIIFWAEQSSNLSIIDYAEIVKENTSFFEEVNISLTQPKGNSHLKLNVWERGTGITSACGSAAIAAVAMGQALGKLANDVVVHQPGGDLTIQKESEKRLWQSGGAEFVFEGQINL